MRNPDLQKSPKSLKRTFIKEFLSYNAERVRVSLKSFRASWKSFGREAVGRIPVSNSSGGLLKPLIEPFLGQVASLDSILLVSEPSHAGQEVMDYLMSRFGESSSFPNVKGLSVKVLEDMLGKSWSPNEPNYDLASQMFIPILERSPGLLQAIKSDIIVMQSVLEHVGDPVKVLDNLLALRKSDESVLAVQTCNPIMRLHRHPIDTLRFHEDFFTDFSARRGVDVFVKNSGASIFAILSTRIDDSLRSRLDSFIVDR